MTIWGQGKERWSRLKRQREAEGMPSCVQWKHKAMLAPAGLRPSAAERGCRSPRSWTERARELQQRDRVLCMGNLEWMRATWLRKKCKYRNNFFIGSKKIQSYWLIDWVIDWFGMGVCFVCPLLFHCGSYREYVSVWFCMLMHNI